MRLRLAHGVFAMLALLPFAKSIGGGPFARLAVADLATAATAAATIFAARSGGLRDALRLRVPRSLLGALALLFLFVCISFPFAESQGGAAVESATLAANVVLFALIALHVRTRADLLRAFDAWEIAAAGVVALGMVGIALLSRGVFDSPLTDRPLLTSTFPRSGQLASYIVASLPILRFQSRREGQARSLRLARHVLFVAALVTLAATGSRAGLAIGLVVALALEGRRLLSARVLVPATAALLLFVIAAGFGAELPFAVRRAAFVARPSAASLETLSPSRHYQWVAFERETADAQLLGVGPGDFQRRVTALAPAAFRPHEMHNTFLGVWVETGLGGLIGVALLTGAFLRFGVEARRRAPDAELAAAAGALLLSFLALQAFGLFAYALRMRALWAIQGLLLAVWSLVPWPSRSRS